MEWPVKWAVDYEENPREQESPEGTLFIPDEILQRHGARVLDPATVPVADGQALPGSTVYHSDMLLVPVQLFPVEPPDPADPLEGARAWFRDALAAIGIEPTFPEAVGEVDPKVTRWRAVVLLPAKGAGPRTIDAWAALVSLRDKIPQLDGHEAPPDDPDQEATPIRRFGRQIGLNHLLVGSAYAGIGGTAVIGGEPVTDGHGLPSGGRTPGSVYSGRQPVQLLIDRPEPNKSLPGRRPVVALLDTGYAEHFWFGWVDRASDPDGQYVFDEAWQKAAPSATPKSSLRARKPLPVIDTAVDDLRPPQPLLGVLSAQAGHCTFEAGLIKQIDPDARVLSLRVMHADGIVDEDLLVKALEHIADLVTEAQNSPGHGLFVDVVSLSCGFFAEDDYDRQYAQTIKAVIKRLRGLGVTVVAAAGNFAATRAFYPSGLAGRPDEPRDPNLAPILGVGAKNPNGSIAIFSDGGRAIKYHAPGAMVVSTFPPQLRGAEAPALTTGRRASFDGDDFIGGFAVWSGTSFAAPVVAAAFTRTLKGLAQAERADITPAAAVKRAATVRDTLWPQTPPTP